MSKKPKSIYPPLIKQIAHKILPNSVYRRHFGRHEDGSNHLWCQITASLAPNEVVLDIGAFKGEYSFLARSTNPKVLIYAFEANPISAQRLTAACEQRDIRLIKCAVVEHESRMSFILAGAQSRIMVEMTALSNQEVVEVAGITLDSWTTENEITPSLIKIDTEGAEAGILRGGSTMFKEVKPIILCEILSDEAGQNVMKALPPSYHYYHIDENSGSITLMSTITRKKWRNLNWLFIPVSKESKLIPILGS